MRELKFRAWNKTEGLMDTEFCIHADGCIYQDAIKVYNTPHQEIESAYDELIIEQYTGLKDKNGVEIYEGDIVRLIPKSQYIKDAHMSGIKEVVWNDEQACFFYNDFVVMNWGGHESIEVIGNIHQNKELLT